jgi:hypothetical protein
MDVPNCLDSLGFGIFCGCGQFVYVDGPYHGRVFDPTTGGRIQMAVTEGGSDYSYLVLFAIDEDGVWRIKFF